MGVGRALLATRQEVELRLVGLERIIEEEGVSRESGVGSREAEAGRISNNRTGISNDEWFRMAAILLYL
jgi:hypothetical protein